MFPNLDPKKMKTIMKQMGMSQDEIEASKVIIEKEDGSKIIIETPSVTKIKMQGQESYQIVGDSYEEKGVSEEDIQTIVDKTNCSKEEAEKTLKRTGDLAESIMELTK